MIKNYSILRGGQYKELSKLSLPGSVLDVGGKKTSDYHLLIKGYPRITTINILPDECDIVVNIEKEFPFKDNSYDHAVCLNVLEHVYGFQNAVSEILRVLKPGGILALSMPFMHHIHGCPDDYFRYTDSAYRRLLGDVGFTDIKITPLGFGVFSVLYQSISGSLPGYIGVLTKHTCVACDNALRKISPRYARMANRLPLGYFVTAKKI